MAGARLVLVDLLVSVRSVQPSCFLQLLFVGVRLRARLHSLSFVVEAEGGDGGGNFHLSARPGALQEDGEAVGVSGTVTLYTHRERERKKWLKRFSAKVFIRDFAVIKASVRNLSLSGLLEEDPLPATTYYCCFLSFLTNIPTRCSFKVNFVL